MYKPGIVMGPCALSFWSRTLDMIESQPRAPKLTDPRYFDGPCSNKCCSCKASSMHL